MLRTIELENTIRQLFCCEEELSLPLEEALDCLNYDLLSQTIQNHAEPVYAYRADTLVPSGCCYRGNLLLPLPATLLYSMPYVRATAEGGISFERRLDLLILEDMTLEVVSSARFRACEGEFESDYRAVKTKDLDLFPQVIDLDLNLLAMRLAAMCDEYLESPMPTYEL